MDTANLLSPQPVNATGVALISEKNIANAFTNQHPLKAIYKAAGIKKTTYSKFYKVYKNETSVAEVKVNNFKPFCTTHQKIKAACNLKTEKGQVFSLPADKYMYYGFLSRAKAMKFAKAMALKYISKLIKDGEKSYSVLLKYREEHYEDLNINLLDSNIRKLDLTKMH